ncbi:MAG: GTP cyclohydrolase [Bacteroidota bacterium]
MKTIENLKNYKLLAILFIAIIVVSCSDDDDAPPEENLPEVITTVTLIFTPDGGGTPITATAVDPDGEGIQDLIEDPAGITLAANTTYTLTYTILNTLPDPDEDIGEEIEEEDDEHQIFYEFTADAFSSPTGDGNLGAGNADDDINYEDEDSDAQDGSGNPVGLVTTWTTAGTLMSGTFRANLQHQPGVKTADSDSTDGDTDFDLTFDLVIQ